MSKAKAGRSTLSGLVDSDSDDTQFVERSTMPTPDSAAENKMPEKKTRGKPKSNAPTKVTKTRPARRTSGRLTTQAKAGPVKTNRKVLADRTNNQQDSGTEEVDDFEQADDLMEDEPPLKPTKRTKAATEQKASKAIRGKPAMGKSRANEISSTDYSIAEDIVSDIELASRPTKKAISSKRGAVPVVPEKVILETQIEPMDIDDAGDEEEELVENPVVKNTHTIRRPQSQSRSRQPHLQRRRAGSASDTERSDPVLRRKLGDLTKKYETLNIKYQDLREIGLKEAERNFERVRKESEAKTAASEKLLASLKADITAQTSLAKDSRGLKKKFETQAAELASLKAQVAQMTASLTEAQAENKTLSTKLAANRTAAASVESTNAKVPGSAVQSNGGIRMVGSAEAAQAAQAAQLKEDLYSDLTGLLIRSVKRDPEDDVFDCIQTGRNGTLHFKLAVANDKSVESYDDAQCQYVPQLDPSRDKDLMDLMPDYLIDEITFPRPQAARFYARVMKALTEKMD